MNATNYLTGESRKDQLSKQGAYEKDYADFVDLAVHELDAPMRKLSSFVDMLNEKVKTISEDKEAQQYLRRIENCAEEMRSLIDDMAILAKVNSNKAKPDLLDLKTPVQKALYDLRHIIKERNAMIALSDLPVIEGDAYQYTLLFRNILDNAIKFSKKETIPEIYISSSMIDAEEKNRLQVSDDKQYFKLEVKDNGIGFRQEYAEKIFKPFMRIHGKSQYKGNGIGLTICKEIVEGSGGMIYAQSNEDSGSRFVIILPQISR